MYYIISIFYIFVINCSLYFLFSYKLFTTPRKLKIPALLTSDTHHNTWSHSAYQLRLKRRNVTTVKNFKPGGGGNGGNNSYQPREYLQGMQSSGRVCVYSCYLVTVSQFVCAALNKGVGNRRASLASPTTQQIIDEYARIHSHHSSSNSLTSPRSNNGDRCGSLIDRAEEVLNQVVLSLPSVGVDANDADEEKIRKGDGNIMNRDDALVRSNTLSVYTTKCEITTTIETLAGATTSPTTTVDDSPPPPPPFEKDSADVNGSDSDKPPQITELQVTNLDITSKNLTDIPTGGKSYTEMGLVVDKLTHEESEAACLGVKVTIVTTVASTDFTNVIL